MTRVVAALTLALQVVRVAPNTPATSGGQPPMLLAADSSYFLWTQDGAAPDVMNSEWWFRAYIDGGAPIYLWGWCEATATPGISECSAPMPLLPNGTHNAQLTAAIDVYGTTMGAVESAKSMTLTWTVTPGTVTPAVPKGVALTGAGAGR